MFLIVFQSLFIFSSLMAIIYYYKRHKWSVIKSRKLVFKPVSKK